MNKLTHLAPEWRPADRPAGRPARSGCNVGSKGRWAEVGRLMIGHACWGRPASPFCPRARARCVIILAQVASALFRPRADNKSSGPVNSPGSLNGRPDDGLIIIIIIIILTVQIVLLDGGGGGE